MNRAFIFNNGVAREVAFAEAPVHLNGEALVWVHIDGSDPAGLDWVQRCTDLPEVAHQALLAVETRPRTDPIGNGAIINLRSPGTNPENDPDTLVSTRFWVERGRTLSLAYRPTFALEPTIMSFLAGEIRDPGDLITRFARESTALLDPDIAALGDRLDEIEIQVDANIERSTRRQVSALRGEAIGYRRFIAPQRFALERLATLPVDWLDEHDRIHLRDAADRFARMSEELESVRERAAVVHDELTDLRSEKMDSRALLLSIVALIFLPLTFITGLLGMNVKGIPYAEEVWAFWGVVGFCAVMAMMVLGWFIRVRWVRGR
jgi:zinc transporter